jgi:hypothetical protein
MTRREAAQPAGSVLACLVLTTLVGAGCGGSSKPKTVDDFCKEKVTAECQKVATKCVSSVDTCVANRLSLCHDFAAQAQASGTRNFIPGNIGNCVSKTESVYGKNGAITPADLDSVDEACNWVFQGNAKELDACTVRFDCLDKNQICDKGLCAKPVNKNKGDLCGNPGEVCKTGAFCQMMAATTYKCADKASLNQTCSEDIPCKEDLRCALGSCADRVGNTGSCSSDDDCDTAAPFCDPFAGNKCSQGLLFASGSNSCAGFTNPGSVTTGAGGHGGGGSGGASGAAGSGGGHAGSGGATGTAGAGGTGTGGTTGTAGSGGTTGAAGGGGTGTAGSAGGSGGTVADAGTD